MRRLRALDDRVLGPPKQSAVPWWLRLGGLFGALAGSGAVDVAEPGAGWIPRAEMLVGVVYLAAVTILVLRDPARAGGRYAVVFVGLFWVLLGLLPLLSDPAARRGWYVVPFAGLIAIGVAVGATALRTNRAG